MSSRPQPHVRLDVVAKADRLPRHVRKPRQMQLVRNGYRLRRPVAVLGQNQRPLPARIVALERIGRCSRILSASCSIAPDSRRSASIGFVGALLRPTVQLAHGHYRNLKLLRQKLELTREFGTSAVGIQLSCPTSSTAGSRSRPGVDQPLLQPTSLGADLHHREVRRIVDIQRRFADLTRRRARRVQSSSLIRPDRMSANFDLRLG